MPIIYEELMQAKRKGRHTSYGQGGAMPEALGDGFNAEPTKPD